MKIIITESQLEGLLFYENKQIKKPLLGEQDDLYSKIKSNSNAALNRNPQVSQQGTKLTQKQVSDIQGFVDSSIKLGPVPLKIQNESDKFIKWVNDNYKSIANYLNTNISSKNDFVKRACSYKVKDEQTLGTIYSKSINLLNNELESAKEWWNSWLSSENTMTKFIKLNNLNWFQFVEKYRVYSSIISSANLEYYYNDNNVNAYINCGNLKTINVNLFNLDSNEIVNTLIHEIQHLLYCYYPLTPDENVTQFKSSDQCYQKNKKIYDNTNISIFDKVETLIGKKHNQISRDLGIDVELVFIYLRQLLYNAYERWNADYILNDNSEFQSRLSGTRNYFGVSSGKNITKEMFANYIKNENRRENDEVEYIIAHWAIKEFPPLDQYINDLNTKFVKLDLPSKSGEGTV